MKKKVSLLLIVMLVLSTSFIMAGGQSEETVEPSTVEDTGNLERYKDSDSPVVLDFYYVVGVAGPLAQVIDGMVEEFNNTHENIIVQPVYTGNYNQTMAKVQSSIISGTPPDVFVVEIS